jgi:arsenic resistance protein ArsH
MPKNGASELHNVVHDHLHIPAAEKLAATATHKPRILLLYGSLRARSYSRFLTMEAARLLEHFGAECRIYDPHCLPLPDDVADTHPKVQELRELAAWSEGQVWCSPERHGAMSGVMKSQIDWIPLSLGAIRPTQGKTLAVMQSERRLAVLQRREPDARPRPLDADDHYSQPIVGGQGLQRI